MLLRKIHKDCYGLNCDPLPNLYGKVSTPLICLYMTIGTCKKEMIRVGLCSEKVRISIFIRRVRDR